MYTGGFMHLVDWHATLVDLAGASNHDSSGTSVWRAILNNGASPREELGIYTGMYGSFYRKGNLKLLTGPSGKTELEIMGWVWPFPGTEKTWSAYLESQKKLAPDQHDVTQLFNLMDDPGENN